MVDPGYIYVVDLCCGKCVAEVWQTCFPVKMHKNHSVLPQIYFAHLPHLCHNMAAENLYHIKTSTTQGLPQGLPQTKTFHILPQAKLCTTITATLVKVECNIDNHSVHYSRLLLAKRKIWLSSLDLANSCGKQSTQRSIGSASQTCP